MTVAPGDPPFPVALIASAAILMYSSSSFFNVIPNATLNTIAEANLTKVSMIIAETEILFELLYLLKAISQSSGRCAIV